MLLRLPHVICLHFADISTQKTTWLERLESLQPISYAQSNLYNKLIRFKGSIVKSRENV